ncbi:MAG: hypothetical protein LC650_00830 [Actinobacteria bacterium]|nr:hypothetical protein [Actinomycetota bacterium]
MRSKQYDNSHILAWDAGFEAALAVMVTRIADAAIEASSLHALGGRPDRDDYSVAVRAGVQINRLTREWFDSLKETDTPEVYNG